MAKLLFKYLCFDLKNVKTKLKILQRTNRPVWQRNTGITINALISLINFLIIKKKFKFDIREDEEQQKKLQETVELLVAAGYFRARIKGLSAFDKIVGGMTWCITTCNFDVDVDLLFQESSTIGQKM